MASPSSSQERRAESPKYKKGKPTRVRGWVTEPPTAPCYVAAVRTAGAGNTVEGCKGDIHSVMERGPPRKRLIALRRGSNGHRFAFIIESRGTVLLLYVFGFSSQFRRAAISVPASIAEGFRRRGVSDKARFFNIAQASVEECRYYLILTRDLGYADTHEAYPFIQEVSILLGAYLKSILTSVAELWVVGKARFSPIPPSSP